MSRTALYYPGHELPMDWLRKYLLFEDQVARLVPSNHRFSDYPEFLRFREALPDAIVDVPSSTELTESSERELELLEQAFREIQASDPTLSRNRVRLSISFEKDGSSIVHSGYVRLHRSKVSEPVLALLNKYRLGPAIFQSLMEMLSSIEPDPINPKEWIEVKAEASNLILSGLTAKVAWKNGYGPVTSSPMDYSLVALNALGIGPRSGSFPGPTTFCMLASKVISTLVPESIENIPIETYLELRREFADVREPFQRLITESNVAADLRGIADADVLKRRLEDVAKDVSDRIEKIQSKRKLAQVKQWAPFALLSLFTLAGVMPLDFQLALALAGTTVTIGIIEKAITQADESDHDLAKVAGAVMGLRRELPDEVERSVRTLL